jgi:twitching motility two-component system response regulator PilG
MTTATAADLIRDGIAAARTGDKARARPFLQEAAALEPTNTNAWLWLAGVAETPRDAVRALERVLEIEPRNDRAQAGLKVARLEAGIAAAKANQREEARGLLRKVCAADPTSEAGWLWLAGVTDDPSESIRHLERALQLNPTNERAKAGLDYFRSKVPTLTWSCPICEARAETKNTTCPSCRAILDLSEGDAAIGNGNADGEKIRGGAARLTAKVKTQPDFDSYFALGMALLNLGKPDDAVVHFQAARKLRPADALFSAHLSVLERALADASPPKRAAAAPTKRVPAVATVRRTILVVDDSPTIRKLVGLTMQKNGFRVVEAGDGNEALERIQEEGNPDLILLDINMPGMDGYTLCKQIRQNPATAKIPVIMLSGRDGFFDKMRGKMAGSDHYLTKPFQPDVLVKTVREYCPAASEAVAVAVS